MRSVVTRRQIVRAGIMMAGLGLVTGCSSLELPFAQRRQLTRIGYLGGGTSGPYPALLEALREAMGDLGYVDGKTLALEYRFIDGALDRGPAFAAELVALKLDAILGNGQAQVEALKRATTTVPVVGVPLSGDPVGTGLVASLARPGANVTGLSTVANDTVAKRLQLLREVVPSLKQVAVIWNANNSSKAGEYREAQGAATTLGLVLSSAEIRGAGDFDSAFQSIVSARTDALLVFADPLVNGNAARIAAFARQQRLPSMYELRDGTQAGGLMNYGPNLPALFRRAAVYVDKIVKGTPPAEIPIEQPTVFDLAVNRQTAEVIGLTLPQSVLQQATEIIE